MSEASQQPQDEELVGGAETKSDVPEAEADVAAEGDPSVASVSLQEQLEATRTERDEAKDKLLRTFAELDNFRRRSNDERAKARKYQSLALARDLLPHIDNLRRAVEAAEDDSPDDGGGVLGGVKMVLRGMEESMASHGVEAIETRVGQPFDPAEHEALSQVPRAAAPDADPMSIVQEIERGYRMHEQLIRPAKVIVVGNE